MKTLYLVRHAKSSWDTAYQHDYERPLLKKGINRTQKLAAYLQKHGIKPDLIVSSHAVRAFETACLIAQVLQYPQTEIQIESQLYFSGTQAMENVVFGLPENKHNVMLVGHNPDMTQFANQFLFQKVDYLPTSALVSVSFETQSWTDLMLASRNIDFILFPDEL